MYELVYAGWDVEKVCREKYPFAIIEDASDMVHDERFSIKTEDKELDICNFTLFALDEGFALACLNIQLALYEVKGESKNNIAQVIKKWISKQEGKSQ